MAKKISPVTWAGAKSRHAEIILPHVEDYRGYVEVFGGSGEILLQREPTKKEVFNDIDEQLVNFFRVMRYHKDALLDYLEWIPNSRKEFDAFVEHKGLTDIQRAARWYYRDKACYGTDMKSFGTRRCRSTPYRSKRLEKIRELNERLDRVAIECLDWTDVFDKYEYESNVFFLDPPYLNQSGGSQGYDGWDIAEHTALRERLKETPSPWVLTINDEPEIRDLYEGCTVETFSQRYRIDATSDKTSDQLLIRPRNANS